DNEAIKNAFRAGNVDIIPLNSITNSEVTTLRRTKSDLRSVLVKGLGSGLELGLKLDRPPFNDIRVRQAVYKAIDPKAIIETVFETGWQSVGLPLPSIEWALPEDEIGRLYKRDLDGAKRLLKEAGYENGFDLNLVALSPAFVQPVELLSAQLRE